MASIVLPSLFSTWGGGPAHRLEASPDPPLPPGITYIWNYVDGLARPWSIFSWRPFCSAPPLRSLPFVAAASNFPGGVAWKKIHPMMMMIARATGGPKGHFWWHSRASSLFAPPLRAPESPPSPPLPSAPHRIPAGCDLLSLHCPTLSRGGGGLYGPGFCLPLHRIIPALPLDPSQSLNFSISTSQSLSNPGHFNLLFGGSEWGRRGTFSPHVVDLRGRRLPLLCLNCLPPWQWLLGLFDLLWGFFLWVFFFPSLFLTYMETPRLFGQIGPPL